MLQVRLLCAAAVCVLLLPTTGTTAEVGKASLIDADGNEIGEVMVNKLATGAAHIVATAEGLPPGVHGFHLHAVGLCDPAEGFKSAGGHYNPGGAEHGWDNPSGPHAGDLPNVHIQDDGVLAVEYFAMISLNDQNLYDADGSAVVMHAEPDDYRSDPAGNAGDRIACGVIEKP